MPSILRRMSKIETYYLIDYDNVHSSGLEGCEKLESSDHIMIFFSPNSKKLDMTNIADHGESDIKMFNVPQRNQAVDMRICSYLGYLVGKYEANECSIVIVSDDTDYDDVIKYWKEECNFNISKKKQISKRTQENTDKKEESSKPKETSKESSQESVDKKKKLNQEVIKAVCAAGFAASVANTVAQISTNLYGREKFLLDVHNELKNRYSDGGKVYNAVKPVLSKYANTTSAKKTTNLQESTSKKKTSTNNEIINILNKAGYSSDVFSYVASKAVKYLGVKNGKNKTYGAIVSKYGQGKGQDIYNRIKKHIW